MPDSVASISFRTLSSVAPTPEANEPSSKEPLALKALDAFELSGWFTFRSGSVDSYLRQMQMVKLAESYLFFGDPDGEKSARAQEIMKALKLEDLPRIPELLLKLVVMRHIHGVYPALSAEGDVLRKQISNHVDETEIVLGRAVHKMVDDMNESEVSDGSLTREDKLWMSLSRQYASFFGNLTLGKSKVKERIIEEIFKLLQSSGPKGLEAMLTL